MKNSLIYYSVGPLLYCPANNEKIASSLINQKFGDGYSLSMCLEDTINDSCVAEAESQLVRSIKTLYTARSAAQFFMPKLFIRVRNPVQITFLIECLGEAAELVCGFIAPKFSLENADEYLDTMQKINVGRDSTIYFMPILESPCIVNLSRRAEVLYSLKEKLDDASELVLNIRVGGNDLCNIFGFRRHSNESIHKITPIANIFSDIITVFGTDYVVSGPVWEYYNGEGWESGLQNELKDDRLCGFIGKTVIHPKQIRLVNEAYKVTQKDFDDARAILGWDSASASLVAGSAAKERMNEYKTHCNWAQKTMMLAQTYGVS